MALAGVRHKIVLRRSDAKPPGRAAGNVMVSVCNKHAAPLKAGTHANETMHNEHDRLGGPGLLCRLIEKASSPA